MGEKLKTFAARAGVLAVVLLIQATLIFALLWVFEKYDENLLERHGCAAIKAAKEK